MKKKPTTNQNKQRNKDHAPKRPAGWNIICSATGVACRGRYKKDRVCILLLSPPPSSWAQKQADWTFWGCVTNMWSPPDRATEETHPKAAHSFVTVQSWSTKESNAVISKSQAYLQESQMQLLACLLRAANGGGGLAVLLLNESRRTRGKLANICGYFRLRQFPDWSCLVPPARWKKYHMNLTARKSSG